MKKICLVMIGIYLNMVAAFSQSAPVVYSMPYQNRKFKIEEIRLVSSYYHQDGNNAAVAGGTGTKQLTDFANIFDVKFAK